MSRCLLSRIHQLGVLIDVEDTPNLVISTLSHPFARASPKTSGQQLWLRKSADTSSHQRYLPDPPRLSTSVLDRPPPLRFQTPLLAPATALALAPWCAPSLSFSPDSARNDHPEPPPQAAILPSQTFHWVLRIISSLVAESLKKPLCC
jgi:hypothetical protein